MSLDELARTSTTALLEAAAARTDTVTGRESLRRTVRHRRQALAAVTVVAAAIVVGSAAVLVGTDRHTPPQPAVPPHAAAIIVPCGRGVCAVDPDTGTSRQLGPPLAILRGGGDIIGASPDGTQVAYQTGEESLAIFDLYTHRTQDLFIPSGWQAAARWTPDGVTVGRFLGQQFIVIQVSNGQIVRQHSYQVSQPNIEAAIPSWSPDGSQVAYSALGQHDHRNLYVMNADGTNGGELESQAGEQVTQVAWSPDGTRIAYVCEIGKQNHLFLINPDGSNRTDLGTIGGGVEDKAGEAAIAWSPDGKSIAFLGKNLTAPGWALYVKDIGGATRRLPTPHRAGFTIAWAAGSPAASPSASASASSRFANCPGPGAARVTCLGANRYRFALSVPITITVPTNFQPVPKVVGANTIAAQQASDPYAGVTIEEHANPLRNDVSQSRDPAAGTTAQSMANWLAHRPFARPTSVVRTTVDGKPAFQVDLVLKQGAPLRSMHGIEPAAPTFGGGIAAWRRLTAQYTLLNVPGAGVTVIWSWTLGPPRLLDRNQALIDNITFG